MKSKTKLIIRDPKHSEYRFIKALLKINVDCIKILSLMVSIFFSFTLVCSVIALVSSFIIVKTGLFFVGTLVTLIGIIIINILLILMFINFTFNRKSDKKKFIYVFISGLVISGLGIGLTFIGSLGFNVVKDDEKLMKDGTIEIDMTDNLAIGPEFDYELKEADIDNVKIEYQVSKYCDVDQHNTVNIIGDYNLIYPISNCDNPMELLRGFIDKFNDKEIIDINSPIIDGSISNLTIYASKENIAKLKSNNDKYYNYKQTLEDYENRKRR